MVVVITGTSTANTTVIDGEDYVITADAVVAPTAGSAFASSGAVNFASFLVAGEVYGGLNAFNLQTTETFGAFTIQIAAGGILGSFNDPTIEMGGTGNRIVNEGTIFKRMSETDPTILLTGANNRVFNSGQISGFEAIRIDDQSGRSEPTEIFNSGEINSEFAAILAASSSLLVVNSGLIQSAQGLAIDLLSDGESLTLVNRAGGLIAGAGTAIITQDGNDLLTNRGDIHGSVLLGGGADVFDTRGGSVTGQAVIDLGDGADRFDGRGATIDATVQGGAGDDTFLVSDADLVIIEEPGNGIDTVLSTVDYSLASGFENLTLLGAARTGTGNGLANILTGTQGDNLLDALGNADTVNGLGGDDRISGGAGNDMLRGDEGDDTLFGGSGNDVLNGGDGADILIGGADDDVLRAGDGEDVLIGGLGADRLFGDADADIFRFTRATDSPLPAPDQIFDFEAGLDRIDLTAFGAAFIGTAAFGGTGAEVRISPAGANRNVDLDLDGDGAIDLRIVVRGVTSLSEDDFLL